MIKVESFSKYYGKFLAVDKISFHVKEGEVFGFIGQNGAGKTTTIRALLNLIFKSEGSLIIDGLDAATNSKLIKSFTSYVPSEVKYYENYKARDIFKLSKNLANSDTDIQALCTYFDLDQNRTISELSLGNQKKVSIIQALIKNPRLIILDEPTSGLDPVIQEKLFKLLLLKKEEGMTIFLSSHNLTEVEKYCDRVLIIKEGKVVDIFDLNEHRKHSALKVTYKERGKETEEFTFDGKINDLMKSLSKLDLEELNITKPSLEEYFKKYY